MKILVVSLLKRKVAPNVSASRPWVIYEICRGLIKKGHHLTLLGTGDSEITGAEIIPVMPKSFEDMPVSENPFYAETSYLVQLARKLEEIGNNYDIIHNHTYPEFINLLVASKLKTPIVTTVHAQGTDELDSVLSLFPNTYFISISNAHKKLFKKTPIFKVVYNGVDTDIYSYSETKDDYLLWLGRLSKAKDKNGQFIDPKGIRWAIKLAQETNSRLLLSGNVEDVEFFNQDVKPHLNNKIQWIGEISIDPPLKRDKVAKLMQKAKAFLMTINWYEPFGLVMAEAGSCGTPVIGFDRGSVGELIVNGKTGFVVPPEKGVAGLKEALSKIDQIKPEVCRQHVVDNFSLSKMVENYEKVYEQVVSANKK